MLVKGVFEFGVIEPNTIYSFDTVYFILIQVVVGGILNAPVAQVLGVRIHRQSKDVRDIN